MERSLDAPDALSRTSNYGHGGPTHTAAADGLAQTPPSTSQGRVRRAFGVELS